MFKKAIFISIIIGFELTIYSQNLYTNPIVIPPSPSVASFQQVDFSKVNLYNGLPIINIPVFQIELGDFKFPIDLKYRYDGFKVEEIAGWLGLGWSINAGGMISHVVKGKADESTFGYDYVRNHINIPDPIIEPTLYSDFISNLSDEYKRKFADGIYDGIPDEYIISSNNLTGSIIKLNNNNHVTIPYRNYKINHFTNNGNYWNIIDEVGNTYVFGKLNGDSNEYGIEITHTEYSNSSNFEFFQDYISSWYLRYIITKTNDSLKFNYLPDYISRFPIKNETRFKLISFPPTDCPDLYSLSGETNIMITSAWKLSSIEYRNSKVRFYSNTFRNDLANSCNLDSIEVIDYAGNIIKKVVFEYAYLGTISDPENCRLILKKIFEYGSDKKISMPPYEFVYDESVQVPSYQSFSQDSWGYYNGADNTSLIPTYIKNSQYNNSFNTYANREPNPNYSKLGLLQSITMPTGGIMSYFYEPNSYGFRDKRKNPSELILLSQQSKTAFFKSTSQQLDSNYVDFTIAVGQDVIIEYSISDNGYPNDEPSEVILRNQDMVLFSKAGNNLTGSSNVHLDQGSYRLVAKVFEFGMQARITVKYNVYKTDELGNLMYNKNQTTGGHRLVKTIQFDGFDHGKDKILKYTYDMDSEPDRSSGVLMNFPIYEYTLKESEIVSIGWIPVNLRFCQYVARTSSSTNSLFSKDGHIGYMKVKEIQGENGENGSTLYTYTTSHEEPDMLFPRGSQSISKDYLRGRPIKIEKFNAQGNRIYKEENFYNDPSITSNRTGIAGIYLLEYEENNIQDYLDKFNIPYFGVIESNWSYLNRSIETYYYENDSISNSINYYYENPLHAQLTKKEEYNSDGKIVCSHFYYPLDNPAGIQTASATLSQMIEKNQQAILKFEKTIDSSITEGHIENYGSNLLVNSIFDLESTSYRPRLYFDSYDDHGNLLKSHETNNIGTYFIWGYNNTYPVVKIEGMIDEQDLSNLKNNISTRIFSHNSDFSSVKVDVDYLKAQLNGIMNNNLSVTFFTYKPLVGITSQTNSNFVTTYYEYDNLNRLKCIKNDNGIILKTYTYHNKE
jgi:hypothetical protein